MKTIAIFIIVFMVLCCTEFTQAQQITKISSGLKYELTFNPGDINIPLEKGSYVKRIRIFDETNYLLYEQIIYGNSLSETTFQKDSFQLIHINFDGIADVRFSHPNQTYTNILSAKDEEDRLVFYKETLLSSISEWTRLENSNQLSGTFYDGYYETTYTFHGSYLDTLIIFRQTLNKPFTVEELYFSNDKGRLTNFKNPNIEPAKPKLKKEFGDYNFDDYEDFRIQAIENNIEWYYYLFNKMTNSYELDTLLSCIQSGFFDWNTKMFTGTISTRIDELTLQIDIYTYIEGKLTIVGRRVCRQKFDQSERSDCSIYELKEGELILTDFMPGAE